MNSKCKFQSYISNFYRNCKKLIKNNSKQPAIWDSKKSRFIKKQEANEILSNLGLKTPLSKIPLLGDMFFECNSIENYKINEIVNKFLSVGDKFMPEMHLEQPRFTYRACEPFTKNKERIQKFKETGDTKYIYKNEFEKACFHHNMTYGDFKYS